MCCFYALNEYRNQFVAFLDERLKCVQQLLFEGPAQSQKEQRSRSGKISRLIRLLRAHRLVRRVPHTYRYLLTTRGAQILIANLSIRTISLEQLKRAVA